jgi:uncharacterized membrane protein
MEQREPAENTVRSVRLLAAAIVIYAALFSFFCIMRHLSSKFGDPDFSIFDQGFYTALRHGMPFFNTYEDGSHFGKHFSPIFYLLLPFYAIYPSTVTLVILQSLAVGLGAWGIFLIAKERLGPGTALGFALLFLLYHPLHGVNYDQFNELCFVVAPLAFALYFFLRRQFAPFWVCIILVLMCKEDAPFTVIFWGIYCLAAAFVESRATRGRPPAPLLINGALLILAGTLYLYCVLDIIIPHFSASGKYVYVAGRYGYLGSSIPEVLKTIVLNPFRIIAIFLEKERLLYILELFLPLAFLPLRAPGLLLPAVPTFGINILSSYASTYNTGSRYTAYIIPFLFACAILAYEKILARFPDVVDRKRAGRKIFRAMIVLTVLCTLLINNTPLRIGFKVPRITERQSRILALARALPPEASISTQEDILQHVCHRVNAWARYQEGSEYIMVDERSKWYRETAKWDEVLPRVLAGGRYETIYDSDGVRLFRLRR